MRIATLNGSLRAASANAVAVAHLSEVLAGDHGCRVEPVTGLADIPAFHPERVDDAPAPVEQLRATLDPADGLVVAGPEYAAGLAGAVKNALDWLVGSATLYHKPVAVLSAGTTGGPFAIEQLVRTLSWQGALVVARCSIPAPATKLDPAGTAFTDGETPTALAAMAATLIEAVTAGPDRRLELVAATVGEYDIDVARFGDLT